MTPYRNMMSLRRRFGEERGVTAITTAIGLMLLMGLAAVAVDGSNLYRERGDAQNAADLAAMAASYISCTGGSDAAAIAAGQAQALANGYDDADPNIIVTVAKQGSQWRATIDSTIDGYFSKVLGANTLDTGATALALCTAGAAPVIFAGGDCGTDPTFDLSGNLNDFNGAVHSNTNFKVGGTDNDFSDDVSYVTTVDLGGGPNNYGGGAPYQTGWKEWPSGLPLKPADLPLASWKSTYFPANFFEYFTSGDVKLNASTPNGIHVLYGDGNFVVDADNLTKSWTLIVLPTSSDKGTIDANKSGLNLSAFVGNILAYTNYWKGGTDYPDSPGPYSSKPECGGPAIKMSANGNTFTGFFIAPRGMIEWSGNSNTLNGGLAGWNLKYNGNNQIMNALPGSGDPSTVLLE